MAVYVCVCVCVCVRERDRQRERQTDREPQTPFQKGKMMLDRIGLVVV